jgi:hypothetical protein
MFMSMMTLVGVANPLDDVWPEQALNAAGDGLQPPTD